jgi:anti-sigma factor RsiW
VTQPHTHIDTERMQALLDGELSDREAAALRVELDRCNRCGSEFLAWQALFDDLGELTLLEPSPALREGVLENLPRPERQRVLAGLFGRRDARAHATSTELQEHLDGRLVARESARLEEHLAACTSCQREMDALYDLSTRLSALPTLEPSPGFAEGVMATVRIQEMTRLVMTPTSRWDRAVAWARAHVPSSRQGWAAALGVGVVPAVTFALVLNAVFSSPLVTVGSLVSFLGFKLGDLWQATLSALPQGMLESQAVSWLATGFQLATASPTIAAATAAAISGTVLASVWILYRNLSDTTFEEGSYAQF